MELIARYFPELSQEQRLRFGRMPGLYAEWNERINVISRKDVGELEARHVLHSLAIAKIWQPVAGARIMDVGTGGGFPGIPLAVIFPQAHFTLVDSIGKKTKVAEAVARELGLDNVTVLNARAEAVPGMFDHVVSRAVAPMGILMGWVWQKIRKGDKGDKAANLPNGLICLKGGDLADELAETGKRADIYEIRDLFEEPFFDTKKIVFIKK